MQTAELNWAKKWLSAPLTGHVAGKKLGSGSTRFTIVNPATGEHLADHFETTAAQVDQAVQSAGKAFHDAAWKSLSRGDRVAKLRLLADTIRAHRAELATLESLSNGKTYNEAYVDDLPESADVFDYYAGWIDKLYGETSPVAEGFLNFTRREPVGVCALVVPWNFPLLLACWQGRHCS
jgi:acyl-CoA reductase-like NAD-dependent aldehyde dehydrogenase